MASDSNHREFNWRLTCATLSKILAAEPSFFLAREHARKLFKLVKKLLVDNLVGERCFWETAAEAVFVCPFVCLLFLNYCLE